MQGHPSQLNLQPEGHALHQGCRVSQTRPRRWNAGQMMRCSHGRALMPLHQSKQGIPLEAGMMQPGRNDAWQAPASSRHGQGCKIACCRTIPEIGPSRPGTMLSAGPADRFIHVLQSKYALGTHAPPHRACCRAHRSRMSIQRAQSDSLLIQISR